MLHRARKIAAAALVLCSVTAGCRSSDPTTSSATAHQTVIDYWNGFTGPDGKTMTALVDEFQKENPDIQVKMQIIPWSTYYDKLTLSLAYGGAPDLFIVQTTRFDEFASYNTLKPVDALCAQETPPITAEDFAPIAWKATHYHNVQYAIPLDIWPLGLYYNTKLFKEAGIVDSQGNAKPPTTLAEFLDDAKKLTKDTHGEGRPDQWGFVFTNEHSNWLMFAHQFGGDIVTPDGKAGAMSSPQSLQATRLMCDLIYKYKVAPVPEGIDSWLAVRQGKAAMAMEGIYMLSSLEEQPDLQFSGAPVPQFGPVPATWGGSHLLCQPAGISPEKSRAAWRLTMFLSQHSLAWGRGGQVPARLSVETSAPFHALPVQSQFARQLGYVNYEPQIPKANSLNQFVDPAIEAALLRLQSPEDAMRDADRRIDQLLERP